MNVLMQHLRLILLSICTGTRADAVYLVRFGVVEVFYEQQLLKTCSTGDLLGENAVLGLTPDGRRNIHATAVTMCELCALFVSDFIELLQVCEKRSKNVELCKK